MTDRPHLTEVCATTEPGDFEVDGSPDGVTVVMPCVHKFGGTSVDGPERLKALAAIIRDRRDPSVVVVSAMAGVSNELSRLVDLATMEGDGPEVPDPPTTLAAMKQRHLDALQVIVEEEAARAPWRRVSMRSSMAPPSFSARDRAERPDASGTSSWPSVKT